MHAEASTSTSTSASAGDVHRVLMTADTVGGVWQHALTLSHELAARGVQVTLATMGAPLSPAQREEAAALPPAVRLHESAWRLEWMEDPWSDVRRAGEWLQRLARETRPDVVHLNQFAFGALDFAAPKLVVAHSCVMSWWRAVHGEPAPPAWDAYRAAVRRGLAGAALLAAPTRAMRDALAREHGRWPAGEAVVLPNGRSAASFAPGDKEPVVLCAGRMWDAAKNLGALAAVAPRLPWPVCVAGATAPPGAREGEGEGEGKGACAGEHERDAAPREPAPGIVALGELAAPALAARLARAAIYALPARYEPFGQSVLEAGLSGCALVLGDVPSLREVWGGAACYVRPGDHAALHRALMRLIDDPPLRQAMGARALARARCFTPQRMADAYLAAYGAVRAPRHASRHRDEDDNKDNDIDNDNNSEENACAS
jgi:glycosyltransferase involved in cell wall biosynthesis